MSRTCFALLLAACSGFAAWMLPASAWAQPDVLGDGESEWIPVARVALGPSLGFTPQLHGELAIEATAGVTAIPDLDSGLAWNVEAGYLHETGYGDGSLDAGTLTLGIGLAAFGNAVLYQPRAIVGGYEGEVAIGMRNGITAHVVADLASLELGHQFVSVRESAIDPDGRTLRHDLRAMLGLNFGAVAWILVAADEAL